MGICSSTKAYEDNTQNHAGVPPIVIETQTWKRDSHGLFDYETNDVIHKAIKIAGTTQIFRDSNDLQSLDYSYRKVLNKNRLLFEESRDMEVLSQTERDDLEEGKEVTDQMLKLAHRNTLNQANSFDSPGDPIVHLHYTEGQYWVYHKPFYSKNDDFVTNPEGLLWYSVRDFPNSASSLGYKLKKGDILKLGRARLKITSIQLGDGDSNLDTRIKGVEEESSNGLPENFFVSEEDARENPTCKICFNEAEEDNILISPCKCSGGMKYVHFSCLKNWLESKRTIKYTSTTISYHWKTLECEICKTVYPELSKTDYSLVSYSPPYQNHMILESICSSSAKSVYVVDLSGEKRDFKIGRGHDTDIRVSDISVSRIHATITKTADNELVIKDNNSKFGTLVCLQHPLLLSEYDSIHLQAGRTLLEVQMKEKKDWTLKSCLWVRQQNEEEAVRTDNYLGKFGYTDSFYPDEFKIFWNKSKDRSNSLPLKTLDAPMGEVMVKTSDLRQTMQGSGGS